MANARVTYEVAVDDNGSTLRTGRNVRQTTRDIHSLEDAHNRVNNIAGRANDTINKGVAGTANSARNFSKLAQTIGDSGSGVVGAYATLAANIFAVTAAFNALRNAAQVEQIMNGLEASGARVGKTYSIVADRLREITNGAISSEQSLRAVAQISSAGFGKDAMEGLTQAAFDASVALGRNLQDSMDRITRGVIKLEPELLDELGIMTKLTESNAAYAAALGKNASALSPLEKRQGFLNAVLAEANLKFGGLSKEAGDSLVYDQLAATFADLTKTVISFINDAALPLVKILAGSPTALAGAAVLFGSSISSQLLPGLTNLSKRAVDSATATRKQALESKKAAETSLQFAQAQKAGELATLKNNLSTEVGAKKYKELAASVKEGASVTSVYEQAIKSLNRSESAYRGQVDANGAYRESAQIKLNSIAAEKKALSDLRDAEINGAKLESAQIAKIDSLREQSLKSFKQSVAQNLSGAAIISAGQGNIVKSIRESIMAVEAFSRAERNTSGAAEKNNKTTLTAMGAVRTSVFATTTAVRVLGAAFLNAIPYIGLLITAIGLLQSAWEAMKSAEQKAYEKARENLTVITEQATKAAAELKRIQASPGSLAQKTVQSITIQSNAVEELVAAYKEATKARLELASADASSNKQSIATLLDLTKVSFMGTGSGMDPSKVGASYSYEISMAAKALNKANITALSGASNFTGKEALADSIRTLDALDKVLSPATKSLIRFNTEIDRINKIKDPSERQKQYTRLINAAGRAAAGGASQVSTLMDALKAADLAFGEFYRSAIDNTSYDKTVDGLNAINTSINSITDAVSSGTAALQDWEQILLATGPEMQKFMDPAIAGMISATNQAVAIRDRLKELGTTEELTRAQRIQLANAESTIRASQEKLPLIAEETDRLRDQFIIAQNIERITKSQIQLEQAKLAKSQALFDASAEGLGARIDAENKIKKLQASILQAQKAIIDAAILNNRISLEELRIKNQITDAINDQRIAEANLAVLITRRLVDEASIRAANVGIAESDVENILRYSTAARNNNRDKYEAALALKISGDLFKSAQDRLGAMRQIEESENNIRSLEAASTSLANQISAILTSTVSEKEKIALMDKKRLEIEQEIAGIIDDQRNAYRSAEDSLRRQDALLNGLGDTLNTKLDNIERNRSRKLGDLERAYRRRVELVQAEIALLRAKREENPSIADAGIAVNERRLAAITAANEAQKDEINSAANLESIELAIFDTRKEGLEWQRQALDMVQKQVDAQKQLLEANLSYESALRRLRYRQQGMEFSPEAQQAEEIRTATRAYQLAVQESNLKKSIIDLEYALLDAQRQQMVDELTARRLQLAQNNNNGVNDNRIAQIDATVRTLTETNIRAIGDAAKAAVDANIRTMAVNLEASILQDPSANNSVNSVLQGRADRADARVEARRVLDETIPGVSTAIVDAAVTGIANNPEIARISAKLAETETQSTEAQNRVAEASDAVRVSSANVSEASATLQSLATMVQNMGFRVSEMEGYGGVSRGVHRGAGHEDGRAFDVNIGYGNVEANNPEFKRRMDNLAEELRRVGATVLWKTEGHYNHMHVELSRSIASQAEAVAQAQTAAIAATTSVSEAAIAEIANSDILVDGPLITSRSFPMPDKMAVNPDTTWLNNQNVQPKLKPRNLTAAYDAFANFNTITAKTIENLRALGPQGEIVANLSEGMSLVGTSILDAMRTFDTTADASKRFEAIANVVSGVLSTVQNVMASASQAKIANIEAEIAAEQKRDGKSAASVAKLEALEKKKDAVARKQFNANKKIMMAQAIIATATGITQALSYGPLGIPMAVAIGAMGAAQLAIIASTSYQSSASGSSGVTTPGKLTIGKIGDSIDLAKSNSNPGGEIGYLRGATGSGTNGSNYKVIGSAYGGRNPRGYGSSSFVVGEKGPEIATPDTPITVRPMNDNESGVSQLRDVSFNIQALDARGVEEVLLDNRGHIISMLRDAANSSGQRFLEDVKVENYKTRSRI